MSSADCIFYKINTQIGFGCPAKQGKASAHGEPLGEDNVKAMKENLGYPSMDPFYVAPEVYDNFKAVAEKNAKLEDKWNDLFAAYSKEYPDMAKLWNEYFEGFDMDQLFNSEDYWKAGEKAEATRSLSGKVLNKIKEAMPNLIGGSADLAPSNKTHICLLYTSDAADE